MKTLIGLAAAIVLSCVASISVAQTTPVTPPTTTQPAAPPVRATPPVEPQAATPDTPAMPAPRTSTPVASDGAAMCKTRKPEGEACACLSDTTRVGVSRTNPDGGRNQCVMGAT